MADIDPATVKAAHLHWHDSTGRWRCRVCGALPVDGEHCEPYRLADALANSRAGLRAEQVVSRQLAQALAAEQEKVARAWDEGREAEFRAGGWHAEPGNPYRAPLADQPEHQHEPACRAVGCRLAPQPVPDFDGWHATTCDVLLGRGRRECTCPV